MKDDGFGKSDPDSWSTANDPMTDAQRKYLTKLIMENESEELAGDITKAEAAKLIDVLQRLSKRRATLKKGAGASS